MIAKKKAAGIHNGDSTHHQDQSILPVSLRTTKTMSNVVVTGLPPVATLFSIDLSFIVSNHL
jgi:hypothetical protein